MKKQPDKGKITALYERLSHDDERAGESVSIENQKRILEDYAQKNGFTNIRHFTDDGVRGTTFKRPGLDAMLEEIRAGNVATVIIKDQSRIGRDVVEVGLLKRTFDEYHVRFIAANDNLDTANGFDIMSIFRDVINEWYVADTSRKIKTVFKSRMEKGLRCSGSVSYGYKRVTWARNGKKRIVWRCVSRLEFGTKYCHNSPTLDESRLHNAILAAMNEYAAIRQEVCPDVLAMVEEAKRAMSQAGAMLLELKKRMDEVSQEQSDVLDRLLANMADAELNARMKALTDEKEALKAQILKVQQKEVSMAEQAAKRQQMWDSLKECSAGYTEFDDEFVRQIIRKITVEDAETIHVHFRDSDVVLEQGLE